MLPIKYILHIEQSVCMTAGLQGAAVFSVSSAADYWRECGAAQENADRHTVHILYHCNATQRRSTCMQTPLRQYQLTNLSI